MQNEKNLNKNTRANANRDPVTGTSGSASAIGRLGRQGGAESVNPTDEAAYWREHHSKQWFGRDRPYDQYEGAYRTGYEGYSKYGGTRDFDACDADLQRDYEKARGTSKLSWEEARDAARAAWHKVHGRWERMIDFDVYDQKDNKIGTVQNLWADENNQPTFLGVKTGWIFGKNHVVPVHTATINQAQRIVRIPFTEDKVKDAPNFDPDYDLSDADEERIYAYYGLQRPQTRTGLAGQAQRPATIQARETVQPQTSAQEQANIKLAEEQLKVGKREVIVGGVRLRKVVRTEIVNQPVELKREEIVVERVPAGTAEQAGQPTFKEEDVFIPLRREEPVIQKEARVREEVRVRKEAKTEEQTVSGQVRKEDVEVQKEGEEPRFATEPGAKRDQPGKYEPKERGRRP